MKRKVGKMVAVALSLVALCSATACGGDNTPSAVVDANYEWVNGSYTDASQLTSWSDLGQSKQLNLVAWNTQQKGGFKKYTSSNDVVYPEIKRITGVTIDTDKSFDNAGKQADVRYGDLIMTGLPDIAYGQWVDKDAVYDLTELIDEYCPTIKARMPASVWDRANINGGEDGKVYSVPYGLGDISLSAVDPEADPDKMALFDYSYDYYPYIYVREDILLDAYPDAKSTAEIQEIFDTNGGFTEEELFDVEITSSTQFRTEFLPKIYDTIRANSKYKINAERWVEPMLVHSGTDYDTWSFMGVLIPQLLGATGTYENTAFSYWDAIDQEIKLMFEQDFYKAEVQEWAKLIAQGKYVDNYGFLNTNADLQSELNRGYYAITYGPSCLATGNQATLDNGETVKYRKVYMKIPKNEHFEYFCQGEPSVNGVCIFKDSVKESDLPQILRWLDFQCSELCDKLVAWGPETAGLFTESTDLDGNTIRQFKDETLVQQMVYSTVTLGSTVQKYNLANAGATGTMAKTVFTFYFAGGSKDHPKCYYDLSSMSSMLNIYYSSSRVHASIPKVYIGKTAQIWKWKNVDLDGVEKVWARRDTLEAAFKQVLTSGNSFDSKWNSMLATANTIGFTQDYFGGEFQEAFLNLNENYLENFYKD